MDRRRCIRDAARAHRRRARRGVRRLVRAGDEAVRTHPTDARGELRPVAVGRGDAADRTGASRRGSARASTTCRASTARPCASSAQVVDGSSEVLNGLQLAAVYGPYFSVTYGPAHHLTLQPPPGRVDSNDYLEYLRPGVTVLDEQGRTCIQVHAPGEARLRVTVRDAQGSPVPSFTEPVYLKLCHLPRGKGIKHLVFVADGVARRRAAGAPEGRRVHQRLHVSDPLCELLGHIDGVRPRARRRDDAAARLAVRHDRGSRLRALRRVRRGRRPANLLCARAVGRGLRARAARGAAGRRPAGWLRGDGAVACAVRRRRRRVQRRDGLRRAGGRARDCRRRRVRRDARARPDRRPCARCGPTSPTHSAAAATHRQGRSVRDLWWALLRDGRSLAPRRHRPRLPGYEARSSAVTVVAGAPVAIRFGKRDATVGSSHSIVGDSVQPGAVVERVDGGGNFVLGHENMSHTIELRLARPDDPHWEAPNPMYADAPRARRGRRRWAAGTTAARSPASSTPTSAKRLTTTRR